MKKITKDELKEVLRLHKLWLENDEEGVRADFSNTDLSRKVLYNKELQYANFTGANLSNCNMTGSRLFGTDFTGATLTGTNFNEATMTGSILVNVDATGASFVKSILIGTRLQGSNFSYTDFSNAILGQIDFSETVLLGVNFYKCGLSGSNFYRVDLTDVNFELADLGDVNLVEAILTDVNFEKTDLEGTFLNNYKGIPASLGEIELGFYSVDVKKEEVVREYASDYVIYTFEELRLATARELDEGRELLQWWGKNEAIINVLKGMES